MASAAAEPTTALGAEGLCLSTVHPPDARHGERGEYDKRRHHLDEPAPRSLAGQSRVRAIKADDQARYEEHGRDVFDPPLSVVLAVSIAFLDARVAHRERSSQNRAKLAEVSQGAVYAIVDPDDLLVIGGIAEPGLVDVVADPRPVQRADPVAQQRHGRPEARQGVAIQFVVPVQAKLPLLEPARDRAMSRSERQRELVKHEYSEIGCAAAETLACPATLDRLHDGVNRKPRLVAIHE